MALTNAERQARYRKRIKERASLDALPDRARAAADLAVTALWSFYSRPASDGQAWGNLDGYESKDDLRKALAEGRDLIEWCRASLDGAEELGATSDEIAAWRLVLETFDALHLG
ncbi:MAG: hypothetical protein COW16_07135 [Sphingomonadales bacterium CG12_big_fil_rev_8_21_14_0_65_65_10]|nr:MAG: hypothetical protein COW16_07135 [Sphingomonadales bacterium CG12_big_fil_rev_8_21_14_0_65_65_10]